jgi:hypothetical protein
MIYLLFNTLDRILTSSSLRRSRVHLSTGSGSLVDEALLAIIEKHYNDLPNDLPNFNAGKVYTSTTGLATATASPGGLYRANFPNNFIHMHQHTIIPDALAPRRGDSEPQTTRKRQPSRPRLSEPTKTADEPDNTVPLINVPHFRQVHQHTISPEALAPRRGDSKLQTPWTRRPRLSERIKTSDEPDDTIPPVTRDPDESSGS